MRGEPDKSRSLRKFTLLIDPRCPVNWYVLDVHVVVIKKVIRPIVSERNQLDVVLLN
jgi:hypothetical protein